MDNQKSQQGNGSNVGNEGTGTSMGKDLSGGGNDHVSSKNVGYGNLDQGIDKTLEKSTDKSAGKSQDASFDKSASDMHKTIDKAAEAAKPMADRLVTSAHSSVDAMSTALTDVGARLEEKSKQLTEAYKQLADTGRGYVRTSPATSVLIALAAGYTLSKLFGRRH